MSNIVRPIRYAGTTYFSKKDLEDIKKRTKANNHTENDVFIAQKIRSELVTKLKEIQVKRDKIGWMTPALQKEKNELYTQLMEELKKKSPTEHKKVYRLT